MKGTKRGAQFEGMNEAMGVPCGCAIYESYVGMPCGGAMWACHVGIRVVLGIIVIIEKQF